MNNSKISLFLCCLFLSCSSSDLEAKKETEPAPVVQHAKAASRPAGKPRCEFSCPRDKYCGFSLIIVQGADPGQAIRDVENQARNDLGKSIRMWIRSGIREPAVYTSAGKEELLEEKIDKITEYYVDMSLAGAEVRHEIDDANGRVCAFATLSRAGYLKSVADDIAAKARWVLEAFIKHAQATGKASPPAAASEERAPVEIQPRLRFRTTRAQARAPRVRAARQRRLADIRELFAGARMDYPPAQVLLRVFKNEDVVELWARRRRHRSYVHLKDYEICQRSGDLGPKRRRGDMQVPEGFYTVTAYNPTSSFWLAMLVSYPNRSDRIRRSGRDPGGDICIHGDCVTIGCVPLTDRWIEELYLICLDTSRRSDNPTLVHSFPGRLSGEAWERLKEEHADEPGLISFWEEIKVGHDRFEETRIPARFTIRRNGSYRFR